MRTSHSFHAALGVAVLALHACAGSGPASAPPAPSTPAAATTAPASPAAPSATATPARPAAPASREAAPPDPAAIFGGPTPGTEFGFATFQTQCSSCHGNPAVERAPSPDAIRMMPPERIYTALTTGVMQAQGAAMTDVQKRGVAEFMSGRPLGSANAGAAASMPNRCTSNPPLADPSSAPAWNGWGVDETNRRAQSARGAGLAAADVPKLKLKWAFGFPTGVSANAQPTVVAGRVFVGSDNGFFYSLDAKTGCVYWSFEAGSTIRNSGLVGAISGHTPARYAVYFGDARATVYALDAQTGAMLWQTRADEHFIARITAGAKLYRGKLFVPVSSSEEFSSGNPSYPCCTSRGSVVALDANTGKQIWKAWVIPEEPKPYKTMANGVMLYKPAGGAVWNTPTVDPARNAVYFGTGDATTAPAPKTTDGFMAVDIDTGKMLWAYQATEDDVFMGGCNGAQKSEACPEKLGPDMDIGNSPILVTAGSGKRVLLGGTKAADVFALDPDRGGALLYRVNPSGATPGANPRFGGASIVWGGAADASHVYYGMGSGGLAALDPATGATAWKFAPKAPSGNGTSPLGAAPTTIPGVVFAGSTNGMLYAVSAADGKEIWSFDTSKTFDAVNKVPTHGGAIASSGAVVVDGMLFVGSGYAVSSGASGGNALLAFGVR